MIPENGKLQQTSGKLWPTSSEHSTFVKFTSSKIRQKNGKHHSDFEQTFELSERYKEVHCVHLGESFPTSMYLLNLASIQHRTSPVKMLTLKFVTFLKLEF